MILVGAVAYDPKVVTIWDIIKEFFHDEGCPMDYVLYSNYELLNDALLAGSVHVAWNSPLAWVDAVRRTGGACRGLAMRDTDRDRVSHVLVRSDSGIASVSRLKGKTVATGAKDSPQATLIPLNHLARAGLTPGDDFAERRFDVLVGKHGDHVGGEQKALASLLSGESDAACVLDLNWDRWSTDGTADPSRVSVLTTTAPFDHCIFTAVDKLTPGAEARWLDVLYRMDYANPDHREMMDMEGLKKWEPGRTSGFAQLTEATERLGFFDDK